MDLKTILIIGLLVLSYMQYSSPEKVTTVTDPTWGKLQGFISDKNPLGGGGSESDEESSGCPDTNEPVCGSDGETYQNICYAAVADIMQVTPGEC